MNVFVHFRAVLVDAIASLSSSGALPADLPTAAVSVETPRDASHGDLASNAAMVLAKPARMKPRAIADLIAPVLERAAGVARVDIAGPGFLNLALTDDFWRARLGEVLRAGTAYGASDMGRGRKVNVEYVSANPTGPLHAAHARGAVVGDAIANLLAKAGYDVTREYYINDAGAQVDKLAGSTYLRYREALGEDVGEIPEGYYPGEYLKDVAREIVATDGDRWLAAEEAAWMPAMRARAIDLLMAGIRTDLEALGVRQDVFFSERTLVDSGAVDRALSSLEEKGALYVGVLEPPKGKKPDDWEPREQTLYRATAYGDDVDRPLKKSDGSFTYFANDIAYHYDKYTRGFTDQIDVWGADHQGYVKRMTSAVKAVSGGEATLDVKICQLVHMLDDGKPVRMSKRAGTFITLADVIERVGADVVRFIMLTRRNDQSLDFDYARVTEQSKDNPVFYVQYAHARCCSVLRHAESEDPDTGRYGLLDGSSLAEAEIGLLTAPEEVALIKRLASWPRTVETAAESHEPHRVAYYLYDLAAEFHQLWNRGRDDATLRFLMAEDPALTRARLALVKAVALVVASGLEVIGVTPVEEMH